MAVTRSTLPVTTVTANTTLTVADQFILSNGANTLQLYSGTGNMGRSLIIKNIHANTNVSVLANSGQTIDGASNTVLLPSQLLNITCNGSSWLTTGGGKFNGPISTANTLVIGGAPAVGTLTLPGAGSVCWNYYANAASRRWWMINDVFSFGDFNILTQSTQGAGGDVTRLSISPAGLVTVSNGICERSRTTAMGEWTSPSWSNTYLVSGNSALVSSISVTTYKYTLVGKKMTLSWWITATVNSGNYYMNLAIPGGFSAAGAQVTTVSTQTNSGAWQPSHAYTLNTSTVVTLSFYTTATNFTGACAWTGSHTFEVA